MKELKRLLSMVLCIAMVLTLVPAAVFATGSSLDIWVVASDTSVGVGDQIDYTVYAAGVNIPCMQFDLVMPEGLTYVAKSAAVPEETIGRLGWYAADWTEKSMRWSGFTMADATSWSADTVLLTFSCVPEAEGEFEIALEGVVVCDADYNEISASVSIDSVTVTDAPVIEEPGTEILETQAPTVVPVDPGDRPSSSDEPLPPEADCSAGHLFDGEWQTLTEVTCTTDGEQYRVCSRCGAEGIQTITENLPSCTGSDYQNYMNRTFDTFTVPGTSKYVITLSSSSELESSYDYLYVYACDADGNLSQVAKLTGSIGGQVVTVEAPSFVLKMTTDGSATRYGFELASVKCYAEEAYRVVPATGHSYEAEVTEPTCTLGGYTSYFCEGCGGSYQDSYVEALGHDLPEEAWVETLAPTCTQAGLQVNTCQRCAEEQTLEIPALGHSFEGDWTIVKEVTCEEDGYQTRTCSVCGTEGLQLLTEDLPSCTGSDYTNNMSKVFPTVTLPGAGSLVLTFSTDSFLEANYDRLYIYAGNEVSADNLVGSYTGYMDDMTVTVPGDSFTLKMTTDGSVTKTGFRIVSVESRVEGGYEVLPAPGHAYGDWVETRVPTCEDWGLMECTCSVCGHVNSYETSPLGHQYGDWGETLPPSCEDYGVLERICSVCGDVEEDYLDPLGHQYGDWVTTLEPTCTEMGQMERTCSVCGDVEMIYTDSLGHDFVYSHTIDLTCTTDGYEISICTRCGEESRKLIPARHQDLNEDGFCDHCAEPFVGILDLVFVIDTTGSMGDEIDVVKRNITNYANRLEESGIPYYIAVVDYRDFSDRGGSEDYPYSVIQEFSSDLDEILAGVSRLGLGYGGDTPETVYSGLMTGLDQLSWGNGTIRRVILMGDAEPLDPEPYTGFTLNQVVERMNEQDISVYTVTAGGGSEISEFAYLAEQTGGASYSCSSDSDFEQVMTDVMDSIPHSVHIHTYEEFVTEPTCTESGLTLYVCTECGKEITAPIDPLGHAYGDWSRALEPTCTVNGTDERTCERCGHVDTRSVASLGHDHSTEWTVDAEPTCTAAGSKSHHCSRCDHRADVTSIAALGHVYGDWSHVLDPNCTKYGRDERTCSRCAHVDVRLIDPLGHSYTASVTAPTCTRNGYTTCTCTRCGHYYNTNYVDAKGHSYGDWIVDIAATVLAGGRQHRICADCGYTETQDTPRLPIDINTNTNYGQAIFTVVNAQTKQPIRGAQIFLSTENDGENTFTTDANGQVSVILPVGKQAVSAYASGCLTRNLNVNIKPGVNELPPIGLSDKPTYEAEITSERMTLEEIEDAGIDTSDPSNQHVYKYELKLEFEAEVDIPSIITYFNGEGTYLGGHTGGGGGIIGGGTGSTGGGGGGGGGGGIRIPVKDDVITVYPVSEYFYLIIRGEVTWLKEMFDVEMLVVNNSMTDTLEDLTATLELPEGLSLAAMVGEEQTASQYIGHIAEGESESVHWYVRGDTAGSYSLTAKLQGMVMPFEEPIDDVFVAENEIQVWAGNAMHLHFEFPDVAYHADDYPITITLTNVSDITLYNVNHMLQVEQGMEVYYSDGSSKVKIDRSSWNSVGVREFHPGDRIIIETTVNIFFESEVIEYQLQKLCDVVTGVEKLINAVKAVKSVIDIVDSFGSCINGCVKALDDFDFSVGDDKAKLKLFKELYGQISDLASSCATSGNETVDAAAGLANSGLNTALNAITSDPEEWLAEHSVEDIANLIEQVKALDDSVQNTASTSKKFNIFDSIRTAISAVPIRFVLTNVVMTEDENNTTSIPWSYSVTQAGPRYFGVSNVSKYLNSLMQAGMGEIYGEVVPWYWQLIPGLDDPFNAEEAIKYIQATEQEIAQFKAKDATGEVTFRAWVERSGNIGVAEQRAFALSTDNENATYEDGVLTFTGDGTINVTPKDQTDGTLHIEDSEGNTYIYELDVIEKHECVAGEQQVVVAPTAENDGFAVKCCVTCGEILEIIPLAYEDCCEEHTFGDWTVTVEASCTEAGLRVRTCTACGATEYQFDETYDHLCASWEIVTEPTCSTEGTTRGSCQLCGNEVMGTIPTLAHTQGTWLETKAPSAFEEGIRSLHCAVCGDVMQTESIPMTQETFGYGEGEEKLIVGLPEKVTPEMLIAHYKNMGLDVTVTDAAGNPVTYIGTGCKVNFGDDVYTVLLMGDVNGDGILNVADLSMIYARCRLLDIPMDEYQLRCADYNEDGIINVGDTAKLYAKIRFD